MLLKSSIKAARAVCAAWLRIGYHKPVSLYKETRIGYFLCPMLFFSWRSFFSSFAREGFFYARFPCKASKGVSYARFFLERRDTKKAARVGFCMRSYYPKRKGKETRKGVSEKKIGPLTRKGHHSFVLCVPSFIWVSLAWLFFSNKASKAVSLKSWFLYAQLLSLARDTRIGRATH